MKKQSKVILTFFTFLPLALYIPMLLAMTGYIKSMNELEQTGVEPSSKEVFELSSGFLFWIVVISILAIVLLIIYAMHIFKNKKIGSGERVVWIFVVLIGGFIGQLVYLFTRIWPEAAPKKEIELKNTL